MMEYSARDIRSWSRLGQRGTIFGIAMPETAKERDDLWLVTADMGLLFGLERFKRARPDRYLDVGIAEQNMIGIAAGLAMEGNCVFATTYASFLSMRCCEQIRHALSYQRANVKLVASSAGLSMGMSGNTHYSVEDIAIMRAMPGMTVISPADAAEAAKAYEALLAYDGPAYIRLTGELNCPIVYPEAPPFAIGRANVLSSGSDVALIAAGTMVSASLEASKILAGRGVSCTVADMHTIKPLDDELVRSLASTHRLVVTVEEHGRIGGLGGAVAEVMADTGAAIPLYRHGLPDGFGRAASYADLLERYALTPAGIADAVERALEGRG